MQIKYVEQEQFLRDFLPLIVELECGNHYDASNQQHVQWLPRRITGLYAMGGSTICLYSDEAVPVGFLFLLHDRGLEGVACFGKKGTIAIFGLFAEFRSKGLGSSLLREAETYLVRNGGECLYVDTYAKNAGAIRYYTKEGFIPVAYHPGENGLRNKGQVYLYKELGLQGSLPTSERKGTRTVFPLVRQDIPMSKRVHSESDIKAAIDGAYVFCEEQQRLLDEGHVTETEWFANHRKYFTSHYLAADNPRGQSGHGGDEERYRYTQEMVLGAIHKSGTFIDIGCANGYLMEKIDHWSRSTPYRLEFCGLDISPELIKLARKRLPQWKERFFIGNALHWEPSVRYDFVCVRELDYVPQSRRREFFVRLRGGYVAIGGRLILGPRTERIDAPGIRDEVTGWGCAPDGVVEKPHQEYKSLIRRLYWFNV